MKITRVKSQIVKLPAEEPLAGGPGFYRPFFEFVTLRMETDAGIEGIGVTFWLDPHASAQARGGPTQRTIDRRRSDTHRGALAARFAVLRPERDLAEYPPWPSQPSTWRSGISKARPSANHSLRC